ncbi:hypothetical protein EXU85_19075 [Spirosoma sp. KCTC 42546]|uniref:hypothetical protein n=1 Tax=Spirosoma sp. KCTC 42546 TaxID=2520506 RepID=UPI00115B5725|nr:hypothetical protein [Spirosoma sp. KCTC 42546]QDK80594.1 hypothetical protein EXU85_19075 [Spirosoma sp. KCTC 42546]
MKTYLFILAFSGLSILTASAQDDSKLRKDVTYSANNYKHPNKAATARKWETKQGIEVNAPGLTTGPMTSYKQPIPNAVPVGGVEVAHTPDMDVAKHNYKHNYKIQRVSIGNPENQSASEVANKVQAKSTTEGN